MDFSKLAKSLNPYTIKKGFSYLKQYGFQEFKVRLSERFEKEEVDYNEWCKYDILTDERLNHRVEVESGLLEEECAAIMQNFFRNRRKK